MDQQGDVNMTFDEALDTVPPEVQLEINAIVERAGTTDADFEVFKAAGEICAALRQHFGSQEPDEPQHPLCGNEGHEALWLWFGLSRASWLTLPRVLMHAMPDEWQGAMARLLNEYYEMFPNMPDQGSRVQVTDLAGKLIRTPSWLINYRYPDFAMIKQLKEVTE